MPFRSFRHASSRVAEALRLVRAAHARHRVGYPSLVARFADIYVARQYSLREMAKLDLLDPRYTRERLDANISKQGQLELQRRLNPPAYWMLTEDKEIFYRFCAGAGLPVPRGFGTLEVATPDTPAPRLARLRERAVRVLDEADADELIVKPALGVYGRAVVALRKTPAGWVDGRGELRRPDELPAWLHGIGPYDRYVVQQRLYGHPALQSLSGTRNVQTVRMATYIRSDGRPTIGCCQLKIIGNDSLVDNYGHGRLGNLVGDIPRAGGRVTRAFRAAPDGSCEYLERHPRTGVAFRGFEIPHWREACELVERAALAFQPLRTIGWDVAITADGPLLIEGNASWDPPQRGDEVNGEILAAIAADGIPLRTARRQRFTVAPA